MKAFEQITDPVESDSFAQELTALGNRILSANLVNLGELDSIRPALQEMRDFLTIGLEYLTGGHVDVAPRALRENYIQTVFKIGFEQVVQLREEADGLAQIRSFKILMLDEADQQFVEGLRRFKPLLAEDGRYRSFQSLADVERARGRLDQLVAMVEVFMATFPSVRESLRKTFNTATVKFAISGTFEPAPVKAAELERFLAGGFTVPEVDVPDAITPFAHKWWSELQEELGPLVGKPIDPRFIGGIHVE